MFICSSCAQAGDMARIITKPTEVMDDLMLGYARRLHEACRGGTHCDCQHRTPAPRG
jgi:hypothetical protein